MTISLTLLNDYDNSSSLKKNSSIKQRISFRITVVIMCSQGLVARVIYGIDNWDFVMSFHFQTYSFLEFFGYTSYIVFRLAKDWF